MPECTAKFQAMTNAILALDTSILAWEQAQAVMTSNAAAVMSTTMAYQACLMGGMMMTEQMDLLPKLHRMIYSANQHLQDLVRQRDELIKQRESGED